MNLDFPTPKYKKLSFKQLSPDEQLKLAEDFFEMLKARRTVRDYSDRGVPFDLIEKAIATA